LHCTALSIRPRWTERIRWIETRGKDGNVAVTWVPLDLAPILRDNLFEHVKTAIVTSATLATDARFEFLASRLGVDQLDIPPIAATFASPFDFAVQSVIAIPTDIPAPNADAPRHFAAGDRHDRRLSPKRAMVDCSRCSRVIAT
jgi:ATP-dependent DNA helicase DinG